jgi:hypothetical protein
MVVEPSPDEVLDYARDLARQLAELASATGAHALSALFAAAQAEAAREKAARNHSAAGAARSVGARMPPQAPASIGEG